MLHGRGRLGLQQQYEGQGRHHYGKEGYGQNIYSFGAAAGNGKTQGLDIAIATTWIGVGATRGHAGHHRVATPVYCQETRQMGDAESSASRN